MPRSRHNSENLCAEATGETNSHLSGEGDSILQSQEFFERRGFEAFQFPRGTASADSTLHQDTDEENKNSTTGHFDNNDAEGDDNIPPASTVGNAEAQFLCPTCTPAGLRSRASSMSEDVAYGSNESLYFREPLSIEESEPTSRNAVTGCGSSGVFLDAGDAPKSPGTEALPIASADTEGEYTHGPSDEGAASGGVGVGPGVVVEVRPPVQETIRETELRTSEQFNRSQAYARCLELRGDLASPEGQRLESQFDLDWLVQQHPVIHKVLLHVEGDSSDRFEDEMLRQARRENIENQLRDHELDCDCIRVRTGCLSITLLPRNRDTLKAIVQRNKQGSLSVCFEKILITENMRELAACQGKSLKLQVSIENEKDVTEMAKLLDVLTEPGETLIGEDSVIDKISLAYCPKRQSWFWTPDAIEGMWMKASCRSSTQGLYSGIPLGRRPMVLLDYLQSSPMSQKLLGGEWKCYICNACSRRMAKICT